MGRGDCCISRQRPWGVPISCDQKKWCQIKTNKNYYLFDDLLLSNRCVRIINFDASEEFDAYFAEATVLYMLIEYVLKRIHTVLARLQKHKMMKTNTSIYYSTSMAVIILIVSRGSVGFYLFSEETPRLYVSFNRKTDDLLKYRSLE